MMQLRRFNDAGVDQFRQFLVKLKNDKNLAAPIELLTNEALTQVIAPATECPDAQFANRLAAAKYLNQLLMPAGLADASEDVGLWAWLALRFYTQLMPMSDPNVPAGHKNQLGTDESRFIPSSHYTDRHRHLLRHPLQVYREYGETVGMCLLVQPIYRPGDVVEQLGSRRMYRWYKEMLATLSELVVDAKKLQIKSNASSAARRLADCL